MDVMGRRGGCNFDDLARFGESMERLQQNMGTILEICAKDIAQRLMTKVIKRTPVGQYPSSTGKKGGTLRRGWTQGGSFKLYRSASTCMIEINNPVEYASYVEYGHRTANHTGWVPGRFMMTISVEEIQRDTRGIIEKKLKRLMEAQLR